jgi:hypothetical protein
MASNLAGAKAEGLLRRWEKIGLGVSSDSATNPASASHTPGVRALLTARVRISATMFLMRIVRFVFSMSDTL